MDWGRIEKEVLMQTQQAMTVSSSAVPSSVGALALDADHRKYDVPSKPSYNPSSGLPFERAYYERIANEINISNVGTIDGQLSELRQVATSQSLKMSKIENILNTYEDRLESSADMHASLVDRLSGLEQNLRDSSKSIQEISKDESSLSIQVRSLHGKIQHVEEYVKDQELNFATKESFAQLLDSTVDEIKSVGVALSSASQKSSQSISLVESLLQAMHRVKTRTELSSLSPEQSNDRGVNEDRGLSLDFISKLRG
jgi:DNA repair exonuclease SbcCD ATPase subunit